MVVKTGHRCNGFMKVIAFVQASSTDTIHRSVREVLCKSHKDEDIARSRVYSKQWYLRTCFLKSHNWDICLTVVTELVDGCRDTLDGRISATEQF